MDCPDVHCESGDSGAKEYPAPDFSLQYTMRRLIANQSSQVRLWSGIAVPAMQQGLELVQH